MKKLLAFTRLELYFGVRRGSFLVYYLVLVGLLFLMAALFGGAFSSFQLMGDTMRFNSPNFVQGIMGAVSVLTTFIVSSAAASGALRDYRYESYQLTYAYPVSRSAFVLGKFGGIYLANLLLLTAPLVGYALGCAMPWGVEGVFLPFNIRTYFDVFWQVFAPNAFYLTALFFTLSLLLRSTVVNWLGIIAFYAFYFLADSYFGYSESRTLGALLDPYGGISSSAVTVGQSAEEQNVKPILLQGLYLWNRVLWLGVGVIGLAGGLLLFRFRQHKPQLRLFGKWRKKNVQPADTKVDLLPAPAFQKTNGLAHSVAVFRQQFWLECSRLFRSVYLYLFLLSGLLFLYFSSSMLAGDFESAVYPITRKVVEAFSGIINIFVLLLILVFSGEVVWRESQSRMAGLTSSLPAKRLPLFLAKTAAVYSIVLLTLVLVLLAGIVYQSAHNYHDYEIGLYLQYLFGYSGLKYLYYTLLAVALQMLTKNRYGGYAAFLAVYVFSNYFAMSMFRHGQFALGFAPSVNYSDLVGFNGSFYPFLVYLGYWILIAVLFWRAGLKSFPVLEGEGWKVRWQRLVEKGLWKHSTVTWVLLLGVLTLGSFIFYNTDIRNENQSATYRNDLAATYEKTYSKLKKEPQLSIDAVNGSINLFPQSRKIEAQLKLTLRNKNAQPVQNVYLNLPDAKKVKDLRCSAGWALLFENKEQDFSGYKLAQPLPPGDSLVLTYSFTDMPRGFTDGGVESLVRPNGTFLNSTAFLPQIGYQEEGELSGKALRKKYRLAPKSYNALQTDTAAQQHNFFGAGADRVRLALTLSTDKGQTAIAPGYLKAHWEKGNRAYFQWEMDAPIVNFFSIQSGRYAVKEERYLVRTDSVQKPVQLSVYYHPTHAYNVDVMMQAMKDGLDYYSQTFSPYQYRQLRVVEFPESAFAQSFANTIAFSENIGFLTDLRGLPAAGAPPETAAQEVKDPKLNFTYFITLHEAAHQWWGHQITGAGTEGAQFLSESLSQYSAVMALKKKWGLPAVQKLLEHYSFEYLMARGGEQQEERSLSNVLMDQQYIFYSKGICVLYTLQKYLGAEKLNRVLKEFVQDYAFKERPYVTANVLVNRIKAITPDSLQYLVQDGLTRVVTYEDSLKKATYKLDMETLEYTVEVVVVGKKFQYDIKGKPSAVPMNDFIELGILDAAKKQVGSQTVRIQAGTNTIRFKSIRRPAFLKLNPDFDLLEKDFGGLNRTLKVEKG
jgi:ABC-type transport system involved in multi-copper enzyme maturation permease subunit